MSWLETMAPTGTPLRPGDRAPDFELETQDGKPVRLADFRGRKSVVLYFYPKDFTPGCTAESCGFRDAYEDFTAAGAEVIGISDDAAGTHRDFVEHHRLPFTLASDPGGAVRERYGVKKTLWLLKGRETFVIDRDGIVRLAFSSQLDPTRHVAEALRAIRQFAQ